MKKSLYKEEIIKLRSEGKTYSEIASILKCSRTLITYFLNVNYQSNHQNRSKTFKKTNRFAKKQEVKNKFGGKCQICSYDKCQNVLSFHHLPGTDKKFTISDAIVRKRKSEQELVDELKKCILVCANCHGEIHAGLIEVSKDDFKNPLTIDESMVD
jgi:DNA-binding CsgD family transcriptional regulator